MENNWELQKIMELSRLESYFRSQFWLGNKVGEHEGPD